MKRNASFGAAGLQSLTGKAPKGFHKNSFKHERLSETKKVIMAYVCAHPDLAFTVNELQKALKKQGHDYLRSSLSGRIYQLKRGGYLDSFTQKNSKGRNVYFYQYTGKELIK